MAGIPFQLLDSRFFRGANIHCKFEAIGGRLKFAQASLVIDAGMIGILKSYLYRVLPNLPNAEPLPTIENLKLPSDPYAAVGLVVAWLAAQLQNLAGAGISDIAAYRAGPQEVFALCGYQAQEVAADTMQFACLLVTTGWQTGLTGAVPSDSAEVTRQLETFAQAARNWHLDQSTRAIVSAARARNIPCLRISPPSRFVQLGHGVYQRHVFETESDRTSVTGGKIANNKAASNHFLRLLGVPTPAQVTVRSRAHALQATAQLGFPLA